MPIITLISKPQKKGSGLVFLATFNPPAFYAPLRALFARLYPPRFARGTPSPRALAAYGGVHSLRSWIAFQAIGVTLRVTPPPIPPKVCYANFDPSFFTAACAAFLHGSASFATRARSALRAFAPLGG